MSAIWALMHHDGQPAEDEHLARIGAALESLGPRPPAVWRGGPAGLGHRLMPLTPEDLLERQPLADAGGQTRLVFDGRLDNRPELARAFGLSGDEAAGLPDSAFALRAYQQWGQACPARLIGGLACIVWDAAEQTLFAFSTPGNACTLFLHQTPRRLALASMPRGLLALPDVPRRLNAARLAEQLLRARRADRAATFFEGINRLPAGHTLTARGGRVSVARYWQPDTTPELRLPRDEDYVDAFNELFARIVADHLRGLGPAGVMMSSGLDSSTVAVFAAEQLRAQGQRLMTYTAVPAAGADTRQLPGRFSDEGPLVREIARQQGNLETVFVDTGGQSVLDNLKAYFEHNDAPPVAAANRLWLEEIMRRAGRAGLGCLLTGETGNHTFTWAGQGIVAAYLRRGQAGAAWREARGLARHGQARSSAHAMLRHGIVPLLPEWLWRAYRGLRPAGPPSSAAMLWPDYARPVSLDPRTVRQAGLDRISADSQGQRLRYLTNKTDQHLPGRRSQFGLDTRDPTGDQRLIEFCLSLPYEQFVRDGQQRWLARRALAGRLPREVLWNRQRGLQAADWLHSLRARRDEAARSVARLQQDALASSILNLERMAAFLAAWPALASDDARTAEEYFHFQEGLVAGHFILWAQDGAADV